MVESSQFRESLSFLEKLGVFDVVLPFLLIFTIVFAMLEKTKVFGTEKVGSETYTKKSLNALAAFAIAFFAVASAKVVDAITQISANVVVLLFAAVFFLMLVGSFQGEKEKGFFLEKPWNTIFVLIMFIGLFAIFLNAMTVSDGRTWLEWIFGWLGQFSSNVSVATIILIGVVIAFMWVIVGSGPKPAEHKT
ncbi:hypothetical protein HYU18_01115 [Candidatus Woesearchaeota archaeon]|nr:hypothetical protein [Candidatus Woesearchaeota archaeon]